jgi:hypothetical protein
MQVFTSSLPDTLFALLSEKAQELNVPKNKIIEKALALYLEQLNKAAYIGFQRRFIQYPYATHYWAPTFNKN